MIQRVQVPDEVQGEDFIRFKYIVIWYSGDIYIRWHIHKTEKGYINHVNIKNNFVKELEEPSLEIKIEKIRGGSAMVGSDKIIDIDMSHSSAKYPGEVEFDLVKRLIETNHPEYSVIKHD